MEGKSENEKTGTYKQISLSEQDNNAKSDPSSEADGADEQMLPRENKELIPEKNVAVADVKFSVNEKQNGEMKVDIGDLKSAFVGISKEELMKYANDPFWVRLRWFLFISFWIIWLAMLAGAVAIIVAAPKCSPPAPRTWWEQGPLTEVEVDIAPENFMKIKDDKFNGVIVSVQNDAYNYENDTADIIKFLKQSKSLEINVILDLDPLKSDIWFERSEKKEDPYTNYYIWTDYKSTNDSGHPNEPNNWLSPLGGSAWQYSENRKQFYYAPFTVPHLNFRNELVVKEFSSVLEYWTNQGADGIRLRGVPYLLVDESYQNESIGRDPGYTHVDYGFLSHTKTVNVAGIGNVVAEWRQIVKENTGNIGPLILKEDLSSLESYMVNDTLAIDLPRHSELFIDPKRFTTAPEIYSSLNSAFAILGKNWPVWQIGDNMPLSPDVLQIVVMLLPGSQLLSPENSPNPQLLKIRDGASIMYGNFHKELLANETIFAYSRIAAGNPGYLVACNPGDELVKVDLTSMHNVSSEVTIQILSLKYSIPEMKPNLKIPADDVKIPPKSAVVLTYVPKSS